MVRKTHRRKTHKRKTHKRKHSRRHTRKVYGGRGGIGGAELGHDNTTGASQSLYQMNGQTPGLSNGGGSKATKKRQNTARAQRAHNAEIASRMARFKREFVTGNVIPGYEGNEYKHLNRNSRHNKLRNEYLSDWVRMFGNQEGFNANALLR
jgi:hypothetical protein